MTKIKGKNVLITGGASGIGPIRVFDFVFGTVFGIYHAMDNFTGRTK